MAEKAPTNAFLDTSNPQLYFAVHDAVKDSTDISVEAIPDQKHIKAIKKALEFQKNGESSFRNIRVDEWARGYQKEQINVGKDVVEDYVSAIRNQDPRSERQLAKDALINSHMEGHEIEDYDVLLQGINIPDKQHVPYEERPYMGDVKLLESRKKPPEVTVDFLGVNQDEKAIRAVRLVENEEGLENDENIFHNAQVFVNSNYRDFSFEYETLVAGSLRDSNPMPPVYTGNIHYKDSEHLEPETEQVIDDLARRDVESMLTGTREKIRV